MRRGRLNRPRYTPGGLGVCSVQVGGRTLLCLLRGRIAVRRAQRRLERMDGLPEARALRRHGHRLGCRPVHRRAGVLRRQFRAFQLCERNAEIVRNVYRGDELPKVLKPACSCLQIGARRQERTQL